MVNVGKYTIHGWYGVEGGMISWSKTQKKTKISPVGTWHCRALPRSWPNASLKNATMGHVLRPGSYSSPGSQKKQPIYQLLPSVPSWFPKWRSLKIPPKRVTRKNLVRPDLVWFQHVFLHAEKTPRFCPSSPPSLRGLHHSKERTFFLSLFWQGTVATNMGRTVQDFRCVCVCVFFLHLHDKWPPRMEL